MTKNEVFLDVLIWKYFKLDGKTLKNKMSHTTEIIQNWVKHYSI